MNKEKKPEYRIISKLDWDYDIWYVVQKHKTFLWIWYWKGLSKTWINWMHTTYRYKKDAEYLIEQYKNWEIKEKEPGVEWYY